MTPLSPAQHSLPPSTGRPLRAVKMTEDTISPTKNSALVQSSSIASFDTADFFPRDTREYSTRRHANTPRSEQSHDKENVDPEDCEQQTLPVTPAKEHNVINKLLVGKREVISPEAKATYLEITSFLI